MTPDEETAIICEALDIAHETARGTRERSQPLDLSRHEKLAVAYTLVVDRFCAVMAAKARPTANRCGWCVAAAGDDQAAWDAAATYDAAAIKAHTLVCPHNPLVIRRDELLATIVRLTNELPFPDEVKNWTEQRGKLVAEVGTLKARVAELEADIDDRERVSVCEGNECRIRGTCTYPTACRSLVQIVADEASKETP